MIAGNRTISSALGTVGWLALTCSLVQAQAAPDLSEKKAQADALEKRLPLPTLEPRTHFDLSPPRQERFQKYLPKAYRKLSQREPFHLLVLGDASVLDIHEGQPTETFPGMFAAQLAKQFFYTGGVKVNPGALAKEMPTLAMRILTRMDGSVLDAAAILESSARQAPVDVVLLCYGQNDTDMSPVSFSRALTAAIAGAREMGAEVIVCSPWLPVSDQSESILGQNRPLADIQAETASELGVVHADLGDLSRLVSMPEPENLNEGQVFEHVESTYREYFYQDAIGTYTPRPTLHRQLGALLYQDLLDGSTAAPWSLSGARVKQQPDGQLTLLYQIKNKGSSTLDLTLLPLIAGGWNPIAARSSLALEAGTTQTVTVTYSPRSRQASALQEALLRLPVLICSGSTARVETVRARPEPVAVVWGMETLFNQEGSFLVGCQVVNPGTDAVNGTWVAEFEGQKLEGNFELKRDAVTPLNLQFRLPSAQQASAESPLKLTLQIGSETLVFTRSIVITRNLGLSQERPLLLDGPTSRESGVLLKASAGVNHLVLTFDIPADLLQDSPDGTSPAWQLGLNLDARSYGKRLEQGSTATVLVTGKSADGEGKIHSISPWAFGNGYAANFDPKEFKATLTTTGEKRRLTFTLPRTYLYLHEWALDNGNSQLGLDVRLTLNGPEGYRSYGLNPSHKPTDDVDSLSVLELTAQPTQRVTVSVE
ncbi:hypothetical protein SAMN02745166_03669 [Prosthecobacter debontii]|uniref:SGNH hydrolase-type esterase domain-containing protein n=1 Tax=Prosthecobacter debontii TaxID=48467 RepID=A0A1T4YNA8_9BACT|nr:SGNH/GDSL hydrolase family protein [Prosthecobacter debontii]SKB02731.1 hypothetical protein SAMN02745166_03669 [Prosthecobacter debontii]